MYTHKKFPYNSTPHTIGDDNNARKNLHSQRTMTSYLPLQGKKNHVLNHLRLVPPLSHQKIPQTQLSLIGSQILTPREFLGSDFLQHIFTEPNRIKVVVAIGSRRVQFFFE